jgi:hypothetical protein
MNELKPCPFCGGKQIDTWLYWHGYSEEKCLKCNQCGIRISADQRDINLAWNKRAPNKDRELLLSLSRDHVRDQDLTEYANNRDDPSKPSINNFSRGDLAARSKIALQIRKHLEENP